MNSTTAILREMDKNMQNHSVYTYIDSKIVLKKAKRMNITEVRVKVTSVGRELM